MEPTVKTLLVLEFDLPNPEAVPDILDAVPIRDLPHFAGRARIVVPPHSHLLIDWLEED